MKIRQIGTLLLGAMVLASCSVPGTPPQAASPLPSGAATTEVVQATTARTAAAETPTPSASASASASATPSASARPSVSANLGARGRGSKGGAPTPTAKPGATTPPPQPSAQPGTAAPTATPQPTTAPSTRPTSTPATAQAPSTATPTEVVINFLSSVQSALNTPQNTQDFSSALAGRVANGETVGSLLNVGDDPGNLYIDFSVDDALIGSSSIAGVNATLIYNNAFVDRVFQLVDEGNGWKIDSITDITPFQPPLNPEPPIDEPTPTPDVAAEPPVVQPIDTVQAYINSLVADPSGASSGQYLSPDVPSLGLDAFIGEGTLINYEGVPLDDGLGSTASVQYTFSTDEGDYVHTFGLQRAGQVWFISAIN